MKKTTEIVILATLVFFLVIYTLKSSSIYNNEANKATSSNNYIYIKNLAIKKVKYDIKKHLDRYFFNEYKAGKFAGSVLVSYKGHIIYTNTFGYANRRKKIPISQETIFQIGSMSKQFTAIAILQLVSKGKISLDDDVKKFYPNFPYQGITIRNLLTHRNGLPNYIYQFENMKQIDKSKLMSNQEMVEWLIKNNEKPYSKPNVKYIYSNTGYALLAAIIEKVCNIPYSQYIKENIFKPLGMNNSFFYTDYYQKNFKTKHTVATGYLSSNHEATMFYLNGVLGDKGLFTNLEDLHKWDTSLYKGYILQKNWIDSAFTVHTTTNRANIFYGYGWKIYFINDSTQVQFHSGWWQGYQSVIIRIPKDTVTIIVLKNKKTKHPVNQKALIDIIYPKNKFWKKFIKNQTEKNIVEIE